MKVWNTARLSFSRRAISFLTVEYVPPEPTVIHPEGADVRLPAKAIITKEASVRRPYIMITSMGVENKRRDIQTMDHLISQR
jgi:hypothetical protein